MIEEPPDFVGLVLARLLRRRLEEEPSLRAKVSSYRMSVVINTNYYLVAIHFDDEIKITKGDVENPTLRIELSFDTIIRLALGRVSPIRAILNGEMRIKGLLRHPVAAYRMYRLLMPALTG